MVRSALAIIVTQGIVIIVLLLWGVHSFGAFTSFLDRSLDRFVSTVLAAHHENVIMRSETADLVERLERIDRHVRRKESLSQPLTPDEEKSA
jgi:hypothetical protein